MLVIKGVKPSATFGSPVNINYALSKHGLYFHVTKRNDGSFVYDVTKDLMIHNQFSKINRNSYSPTKTVNVAGSGFHSFGKLYGYPECCAKRYEQDVIRGINAPDRFEAQVVASGKPFPKEFANISYVPCNPHCKPSLELGRKYQSEISSSFSSWW